MLMKRREGARRERGTRIEDQPSAGHVDFRFGDFRVLRVPGAPSSRRPGEIHLVVAVSFSVNRRGHRLGHVPLLALSVTRRKNPDSAAAF